MRKSQVLNWVGTTVNHINFMTNLPSTKICVCYVDPNGIENKNTHKDMYLVGIKMCNPRSIYLDGIKRRR